MCSRVLVDSIGPALPVGRAGRTLHAMKKVPAQRPAPEPKNAMPCGGSSALAELRSAAGSLEAVLAYSLAPVFLDFMGFLASALKCCPSI